jgi:hypothetical protein
MKAVVAVRPLCAAVVVLAFSLSAHAENIAGRWSGTHQTNETRCKPPLVTGGTAELTLNQSSNAISGTFLWNFLNGNNCQPTTVVEPITFVVNGSVTGSTFTANVTHPDAPFVAKMAGSASGNAMTFTITLPDQDGDTIITATLTRRALLPPSGPNVAVSAFPSGMIQATGAATAADSVSLTNNGTAPATVTLATTGGFFTLSATSVAIAPRATEVIGIQATSQSPGTLQGTITGSGSGVAFPPIRVVLLTADRPAGTVRLIPPVARPEVVSPENEGTVSFTNSGSSAVQAIAVSDVPWLVPQPGTVIIAAGQTAAVPFSVDRTKRADADAPIGGTLGTLSLRFLGSATETAASPDSIVALDGAGGSTVSVKIVDVVKAGTTSGSPAALAPGQVAYFIAGLGAKIGIATDLLLSNVGSATSSDLQIFFSAPSGAAQIMSLPQGIAPNVGVLFPSMAKNIFGAATGQNGSLQIRGSALSIAAVRTAAGAVGRYATTLPILRSDASAEPGKSVILAGVEKSGAVSTALYVQEVAGSAGGVSVDFLDASGAALPGVSSQAIAAFRSIELLDAAPAGAVVARITNSSPIGTGTRIAAYALVTDNVTADAWVVSDLTRRNNRPAADTFVMPVVAVDGAPPKRDVYLTNVGFSPLSATIGAVGELALRRRPISRATAPPAAGPSVTLGQSQTFRQPIPISSGYLRVAATSTSITAGARVTASKDAQSGSFGTGLVQIPTADALSGTAKKRFSGVDDSTQKTVALGTAGTYRSSLILIETEGQAATARVTLRFTFAAGSKLSASGVASKDFEIAALQMLTIGDIGRAVIGSQRDSIGDLSNVQVDVEIVAGAGRLIPVLQSVDNGSGDVMLRTD